MNRLLLVILLSGLAVPAQAQRESLGIFSLWGAFREESRCYAIAQPFQSLRPEGWRPFASIAFNRGLGVRGQLHFRLSREKRPGSAVLLRIDGRSFQLIAGPRDAWAPDARADAEIRTAMRTGIEMVIETRSTRGTLVRDLYRLRGAATAMDAAAVACTGRR